MTQRFSERTAWDVGEGALARATREARTSGTEIVDLTLSNPTMCGFRYDAEAILAALGNPAAMTYDPDPRGILSAREAVAAYYKEHGAAVDPADVLLTTSTSEAYSFLFRLLCDAGDSVLVAQPSYPLFDFLARLDDVKLESYRLFYDFGWHIDLAELERRIGPRTRALVLVHPNNPTGHATRRTELERLQEACGQHGLALIVDEVFLDYGLDEPVESVARLASECATFVVSGLSKVAALPQMKVGWIVCAAPEAVRRVARERLEVVADTFLSMNAPAQLALPAWLAESGRMQRQILARVRDNLAELSGRRVIAHLPVEAGWNAILRLPQIGIESGMEGDLAVRLVREAGVAVHPGSFYGIAGSHFAVVSTIVPVEHFKLGLDRVEAWCESVKLT